MLLEGLETLYVLAQEGTMGKTGSRLYISQSAVSKRIANLEARLGKKLIEPDGRNIRLTMAARELLTQAAPELTSLKGLLFDHQTLTDDSLLHIATSETVLATFLAGFLPDYLQQDNLLNFSTHHTPVILEKVRAGDAILGVCAGHLPSITDLQIDLLMEEPFVLVYPQQPDFSAPLDVLTINLHNPANRYLEALLLQSGLTPKMQIDSYFAACQLGANGVVPALIPRGVAQSLNITQDALHPLPQPLSRPVSLCYRPRSIQRLRVAKLREHLLTLFSQLKAR